MKNFPGNLPEIVENVETQQFVQINAKRCCKSCVKHCIISATSCEINRATVAKRENGIGTNRYESAEEEKS